MKTLIAALALTAASAANAGTITLGESACTKTNICYNVPNDAGVAVEYISNATQYHRLLVEINGEIYDSGLWTVYGPLVNVPLYAGDGSVVYATLNFQVVNGKCVQMGRTYSCPRYVTLLNGTLVSP